MDRFIYIDQSVQRIFVFESGRLIRDIACSTGAPTPEKYTPAWSGQVGYYHGTFFSFDVYADDAWYLFQHDGAILIHSLPYTLENGAKVYQDGMFLGVRPVSHGCIRISPENARWLTDWNPEGAEIVITDPYPEKWQ
jgi:lipoprotein-anchoring transpeptidase ErfK/SrfK